MRPLCRLRLTPPMQPRTRTRIRAPTRAFSHGSGSSDDDPSRPWTIARIHRVLGQQQQQMQGQPVQLPQQVCGWVRTVRKSKNVQFVDLVDGSTFRPLQAVLATGQNADLDFRVGSAVRLTGNFVSRPDGQSEIQVKDGEVVGPLHAPFPIQPKYHTPGFLRALPHLRPRVPAQAALMRLRSQAVALLTSYFHENGFVQIHPPVITSSDCEGAGEIFSVSAGTEAEATDGPFFKSPRFLTVSSQLHLEAVAQSAGPTWSLAPAFRAERSDTGRHLSEFYMLEAELPFVDSLDVLMDSVEAAISALARSLLASPTATADWLERQWWPERDRPLVTAADLGPGDEARRRWEGLARGGARTWPRITYADAVALLQRNSHRFEVPVAPGAPLRFEHERFLAETVSSNRQPVFVTRYPRALKPFYMLETEVPAAHTTNASTATTAHSPDEPTSECFDLLVPEMGELVGGSLREHRLEPLQVAMARCGVSADDILSWYVDLRRWGCPPHGGFGLGFDRLLAYLATSPNIRDVVAFPRWVGRCDC